jgi:hypothetical protein
MYACDGARCILLNEILTEPAATLLMLAHPTQSKTQHPEIGLTMGKSSAPQIAPPDQIRPLATPIKPTAPTLAFATCSSDDAVMQRLPARNTDDPAHKKKVCRNFDEWLEVLPTDQVVALEVRYDPKTGQHL